MEGTAITSTCRAFDVDDVVCIGALHRHVRVELEEVLRIVHEDRAAISDHLPAQQRRCVRHVERLAWLRLPAPTAEEEGFEPTVAFRLRRFLNSDPPSAMGCTERKPRENAPSRTKILAPNGTERHRDQNSDQSADHETKENLGHEQAAERLLAAVAEGLPASVERARELVAVILTEPIVRRAMELDVLLREGNPLALVRAVELAEKFHAASVRASAVGR